MKLEKCRHRGPAQAFHGSPGKHSKSEICSEIHNETSSQSRVLKCTQTSEMANLVSEQLLPKKQNGSGILLHRPAPFAEQDK